MGTIKAIEFKNDVIRLIDQRRLPVYNEIFECKNYLEVEYAIREMVLRGAPIIGVTAAYGAVLAAKEFIDDGSSREEFFNKMNNALDILNKSRPTAVNLMWAIKRIRNILEENRDLELRDIYAKIMEEADTILSEDVEINRAMAKHGNKIVPQRASILTHCNTGALATAGYGTALGVIREAHYAGKDIFVYADETRPRLQGGRLTAWELVEENIPAKLIADNAAATLIRDGKVDIILVGADRIALNGDTANKIGTFMLSVVAKQYGVPFYIVAPTSTIDFDIDTGEEIHIEERSGEEVTHVYGNRVAPEGIDVYNPAFDVTPNENITGIVTEKGIVKAPFREGILKLK